ncbi:hypothetical protein [Riemerella anatipestifer]|uniref:hypothetical protein n=1 Tax=Riemerella anatipestifer TaxID=34085 RepID=UPI001C6E99F5|nr:hypothetical protein [Riemerella anatipestifer]QYR05290.1 hypothetical protein J6M09_01200 [Riemerella anatipestifer]
MSKLDEIYGLLPDNDNAEISEKDLRDSFSKTFEGIAAKVSKPEKDGIWVLKKQSDVIEWVNANEYTKNIANSTLDTTEKGGVNQMYDYRWNVSQDVGFSMYTGEGLGLGVKDTSFRLSSGYFNVTQGTGNGRTELTVQKKGIELSYSANHDSDDDIYASIGIENGKIHLIGVTDLVPENISDVKQLVVNSRGDVYSAKFSQDTLQDVVNRGNYTPRDILFRKESNDIKEIRFGTDISTSSLYFGTFNKSSTGNYNVSYGIGALENNTTGETNTAIGGYALYSNTVGKHNTAIGTSALQKLNDESTDANDNSYNLAIGSSSGFSLKKGGRNTFIGQATAYNLPKSYSNTFIGQATAFSLKSETIDIDDIKSLSPVVAKSAFMAKNNTGKQYFGIDPNDPNDNYTLHSGMNTFVGNILTSTNGPDKAVMSTIIGQSPYWNLLYRCYNNLFIGSGNYSTYGGVQYLNSVVIGNNLDFGVGSGFTDNILSIHNDKHNFTKIDDGLITGKFDERWLKINGQLKLDLNRTASADGDTLFNKIVMVKGDGTVGIRSVNDFARILSEDVSRIVAGSVQQMVSGLFDSINRMERTIYDLEQRIEQLESNNP